MTNRVLALLILLVAWKVTPSIWLNWVIGAIITFGFMAYMEAQERADRDMRSLVPHLRNNSLPEVLSLTLLAWPVLLLMLVTAVNDDDD